MVSSLEFGARRGYSGPRAAPLGSGGSFLSVSPPRPTVGASDLPTALALRGGRGLHYVVSAPPAEPAGRPPAVGVGQFDIRHISEGRFTADTIASMHRAALQAKTDAKWRGMMEDIRREGRARGAVGWKDYAGELAWLHHWFTRVHPIDYVRDPNQVELVMHPWHTYTKRLGDCDDHSALHAGAAGSLGAPHMFRTYRADPRRPEEWSHVSAMIFVPGLGWVNVDTTVRGSPLGWTPPEWIPHRDWPEPRW